ncbi:multiple epidermal growth factor-like domains protein 10 [Ostrea edulis]|uniref:multiple epidermal growth factor-like domains protein 10 n=1 Tax=Ostrea edulis TaxID=37623 RepID=UPI0024AF4900|nr:multiple epidermal growth factor-like domains protein 10 [Ostrea edulis]
MVMSCNGERLFVSMLITFFLLLVSGNGLPCDGFFKCCNGSKWIENAEKCVSCALGYFGMHCPEQCPFPSFGNECQLSCNCSKHQCNHAKGCQKISDCGPGYLGELCDVKCRYPGFGMDCQDKCLCEQEMCDPANGCQGITMAVVTTPAPTSRMTLEIYVSLRHDADVDRRFSSRDTSSVLSTTPDMPKEMSIQSDAASMWYNFNEKKKGMVISITTLGLLFLILTVMYSH